MTLADLFSLRWPLLAGASAFVALALATGFWRLLNALRRVERRCIDLTEGLRRVQAEVSGNGAAVTSVGSHLDRLSTQLTVDARHLGAAGDGGGRGLELAVRSARQGASDEDLIADYGMSRQEAAFLRRIHGAPTNGAARRAVS